MISVADSEDEREWLRRSFLKVDDEIRTPKGQNSIGDLRREKPPKKPPIMNLLGEAGDKKRPNAADQRGDDARFYWLHCQCALLG